MRVCLPSLRRIALPRFDVILMLINTIYYSATARDYVDHDNNLSQEKNKQLPPTPEKPSNSGIVGNTEELHDNIVYSIIPERQTESPKVKRKPAPRR